MKPELIVGELKAFGGDDPKGVLSWACYRYGECRQEGTNFNGFAIGTGSLFRATGVRPPKIYDCLKHDGTQAIFTNAEEVRWHIRRVRWHTGGVPLEEWEYEQV